MIESPKIGIFEIFSRDELNRIHTATLEVLERTGVKVEEEKALE
jgi:trimethylamine:corrinoid methyltransferase-like protein